MGRFLIVAKEERLEEYKALAQAYNLGFEYNDFFMPDVMDSEEICDGIIKRYMKEGVPEYCTMHGAFMDVLVFSCDKRIREISEQRMITSMDIARRIGAKSVIFHTNTNPFLAFDSYRDRTIKMTVDFVEKLLIDNPNINIYLENMFDATPDILRDISEKLCMYDNYGVCFDYAHASISKTPVSEWVDELHAYIRHVHINDNDMRNDLHLAVGDGAINWQEFKKYYEKYFRDCSILIETNSPENQLRSVKALERMGILKVERGGDDMENIVSAEELLERIFFYMTELLEVKEFSKTVSLLTEMGSTIVNADRSSFWFWDKRDKTYWTLAAKGNGKITIAEGTGMVGRTIEMDRPVLCNNPYADKDFNDSVDKRTGYITKSILCMPVEDSEGNVIGVFQAINKVDEYGQDAEFDKSDIKKLSIVAAFCEKSLESYLMHNEAMVDELTGLKNRYAFYDYYNSKVVKVAEKNDMSIIMCDIDHFKHVNDTYGHNSGDIVLREVANIFKNSIGVDDVVVRWGGEEFIFILHGKNVVAAREFAELLRKKIEEYPFVLEMDTINVTMSFGVYQIDNDKSAEENVKLADDNLYEAKHTGRNKVV